MPRIEVKLRRPSTSASFGFSIGTKQGRHIVTSQGGTPASRLLMLRDEIVAIDDVEVRSRSHDYLISLLSGATTVSVTVEREDNGDGGTPPLTHTVAWGASSPTETTPSTTRPAAHKSPVSLDRDRQPHMFSANDKDDDHEVYTTRSRPNAAPEPSPEIAAGLPGAWITAQTPVVVAPKALQRPSTGTLLDEGELITPQRPTAVSTRSSERRRALPGVPASGSVTAHHRSSRGLLGKRRADAEGMGDSRRGTGASGKPALPRTVRQEHEAIASRLSVKASAKNWSKEQLNRKIAEEKAKEKRRRIATQEQARELSVVKPSLSARAAANGKLAPPPEPAYRLLPGYCAKGPTTTRTISKKGRPLGLSIVGGRDTELGAVYIKNVKANSAVAVDGYITVGDKVLELNNQDITVLTHSQVVAAFKSLRQEVTIKVMKIQQDTFERLLLDANNRTAAAAAKAATETAEAAAEAEAAGKALTSPAAAMINVPSSIEPTPTSSSQAVIGTNGKASPLLVGSDGSLAETAGPVLNIVVLAFVPEHVELVGGIDTGYGAIFIGSVAPGSSAAQADLCAGDRVLAINEHGLLEATLASAAALVSGGTKEMTFVVMRPDALAWSTISREASQVTVGETASRMRGLQMRRLQDDPDTSTTGPIRVLTLDKSNGGGRLGIRFAGGCETELGSLFVTGVPAKGAAHADGRLQEGARLLECNNRTLLMRTQSEGAKVLAAAGDEMRLVYQQLDQEQWERVKLSSELAPTAAAQAPTTAIEDSIATSGAVETVHLVQPADKDDLGFSTVGSCTDGYGGVFVQTSSQPGLDAGDRLLAINNKSLLTTSRAQVLEVLGGIAPGEAMYLHVMRLGHEQWNTIVQEACGRGAACTAPVLREVELIRGISLARHKTHQASHVNLVRLENMDASHGIELAGGSTDPRLGGIVVSAVKPGRTRPTTSLELNVGDRILEINGQTGFGVAAADLQAVLDKALGTVTIAMQRPSSSELADIIAVLQAQQASGLRRVTVTRQADSSLGFSIIGPSASAEKNGYTLKDVVVQKVAPGLLADPPGDLWTGDQILEIDGCSVVGWGYDQVVRALTAAGPCVTLAVESNLAALRQHEREWRASISDRSRLPSISRSTTLCTPQSPSPSHNTDPAGHDITVARLADDTFGFHLRGPQSPEAAQRSVCVSSIKPEAAAQAPGLAVGQLILAVNGKPCGGDQLLSDVVGLVKASGKAVTLTVLDAPAPTPAPIRNLHLIRDVAGSLNFAVSTMASEDRRLGIFVSRVTAHSPAATVGLSPGDRILSINGHFCDQLSSAEALALLQTAGDVDLAVQAQPEGYAQLTAKQQQQTSTTPVAATSAAAASAATSAASMSAALPAETKELAPASASASMELSATQRQVVLNRERGTLGFSIIGPNAPDQQTGVYVSHIKLGSEADRQGLRVGDRVMVINGTAVASYAECAGMLAKLRQEIVLKVSHDLAMYEQIRNSDMPVVRLGETYPGSEDVQRVPFSNPDWAVELPDYNPPYYTAPEVLHTSADPQSALIVQSTEFNTLDAKTGTDRRSHLGPYELHKNLPRNPKGRTGLAGRGALARWGPNHSLASVVSRWSGETGAAGSLQSVLEFVAIKGPQELHWRLPGGLLDEGSQCKEIEMNFLRQFGEQALGTGAPNLSHEQLQAAKAGLVDLEQAFRDELFRGMVHDPRNTDNAWVEVIARHFHAEHDELGELPLRGPTPEHQAAWLTLSDDMPSLDQASLHLVMRAASALNAHQPTIARNEQEPVTLMLCRPNPQTSFGFSLGASVSGTQIVSVVKPNSPAAGLLQVGDEVVQVGDRPVEHLSHKDVVQLLLSHTSELPLTVLREKSRPSQAEPQRQDSLVRTALRGVKLLRQGHGKSFGFSLGSYEDGRHFVAKVSVGGAAEGMLLVGDELLMVNGHSAASLPHMAVLELCCAEEKMVTMLVRRPLDAKPLVGRSLSGRLTMRMQTPSDKEDMAAEAVSTPQQRFLSHQQSVGRDMQSDEQEEIEVELTRSSLKDTFGFSVGSMDSGDHTITKVDQDIVGHRLQPLDLLLAVNEMPAKSFTHVELVQAISAATSLKLRVARNTLLQGPTTSTVVRSPSIRNANVMGQEGLLCTPNRHTHIAPLQHSISRAAHAAIAEETAEDAISPGQPARAASKHEVLVTLSKAATGFGFVVLGPKADQNSNKGVFVSQVKAEPALSSELRAGQQILRLRVPGGDWVDLTDATQAETVAILKPSTQITMALRDNPMGLQRSLREQAPPQLSQSSPQPPTTTAAATTTEGRDGIVAVEGRARRRRRLLWAGLFSCCKADAERDAQSQEQELRVHEPQPIQQCPEDQASA